MTVLPDLQPPARQVVLLLDAITDDHLSAPTPCPAYEVRNLLGHLSGLSLAFRDAAAKRFGPTTNTHPGASLPDVEPDWRITLPKRLDELVAAWREPAAWEGMTQAGGFTFPAAEAGRVALNELTVHGWDLARATGQTYTCDTATLEVAYAVLEPSKDADRGGAFGPAVEAAPNAPLLDRVIALSGRHPSWTPGGPRS